MFLISALLQLDKREGGFREIENGLEGRIAKVLFFGRVRGKQNCTTAE